jgi:hypothetical protein
MDVAYMRSHVEGFLPFYLSKSDNDIESDERLQERFKKYCREIETTASYAFIRKTHREVIIFLEIVLIKSWFATIAELEFGGNRLTMKNCKQKFLFLFKIKIKI